MSMMSNLTITAVIFIVSFFGYIIGEIISRYLPEHHLSEKSSDIIGITRALVIGLATLTLGLLISTGKNSHDAETEHLRLQASKTITLARLLNEYGDEAVFLKEIVKNSLQKQLYRDEILFNSRNKVDEVVKGLNINSLRPSISSLKPKNDEQRFLKSSALNIANEIEDYRWRTFEEFNRGLETSLYLVLAFWLLIIFLTIGLVAPFNGTVVTMMIIAAISATSAIYLVIELQRPSGGFSVVATNNLKNALQIIDGL
jgi:hypothetical protein